MLNKSDLPKYNITSLDSGQRQSEKQKAMLQALKQLIPEIINSDGQLNIQALKDIINISQTTANNKGYELTFAGKGLAKAKASSATAYELQSEKQQSKDFDTSQNVVIRGDNLEVLKILKANYFEQIKMIYIDPPYNTKSDNFIYNDNFKTDEADLINKFGLDENTKDFLANVYSTQSHSGWLAFMYPRLKLARDLLKDDGVLFISIDDNEQANLKLLCDEIFGEDNFVDCIVWNHIHTLKNDAKYTCSQCESILFYAKNKDNFIIGKDDRTEEQNERYTNPDNDPKGAWITTPLYAKSGTNTANSVYSITFSNGIIWSVPNGRYARFSKENLLELEKENRLHFNKNGGVSKKTYLSEVINKGVVFSNLWNYEKVGHTHGNNEELADLVGKGIFENPKGTKLIKQICKISNTNANDLILDFFAGSGTTGDAVMQLNSEDGGNRKFILVQWDEAIKENSEAYRFCSENNFAPVISSITIERLHRAGAKLQKANVGKLELDNSSLDIGYKVFSLTPKPKIMEGDNNLFTLENTRTNATDTLYNMLCATGKPLHTPVQELIKDSLYLVENIEQNLMQKSFYVLNIPNEEVAKQIITELDNNPNSQIYIDGYSPINLQDWLNLGAHNKDNKNISVVY